VFAAVVFVRGFAAGISLCRCGFSLQLWFLVKDFAAAVLPWSCVFCQGVCSCGFDFLPAAVVLLSW